MEHSRSNTVSGNMVPLRKERMSHIHLAEIAAENSDIKMREHILHSFMSHYMKFDVNCDRDVQNGKGILEAQKSSEK
jgi:hypothetical protein